MSQQLDSSRLRKYAQRLSGYLVVLAALLLTSVAPCARAQAACNVIYTVSSQWGGGFGAGITIQNTGTTAWTSWTLTWTFANGQTVSQLWNGTETQSGANVTVQSLSYDGSIPAGGSYSGLGFNGTWNNVTNAVPASFAVNGTTCGAATGGFKLAPSASTLTIAQGSSANDTITVTDVSPFTGSVAFSASGMPSGITASFSPTSSTSSSVVTFAVAASTAAGTYPITITGTSGSLAPVTTTITITVPPPSGFTLTPSASALSIIQGASGTDTIAVKDTGTFTGSVSFAASGMPTGVTASFSPAASTSSSVLTFAVAATTVTGTYPITITGSSGTLTPVTTSIALTVTGIGGFTLSGSPTSLTVAPGASATDTITVTDVSPFAGSVTFAASGLPSGVTAAFSPASSTGSSVVTFTAPATAASGTSTVTITGTSGTLTASTTITLTVGGGIGACQVIYTISPQNSNAFGAAITIENTSTTALSNWTLTWSFANGQTVSSLWNGIETQSGANVTVKNQSYNGSIPAGGSATGIGFNGTWNGVTNSVPTNFAVNGTACGGVGTGSFTLKPSVTSLSVALGASVTDTITVTDVSPFAGSVAFTASGLPSGVTATFSPASSTSSSVVTFATSSVAAAGSYVITINGAGPSGTPTASTTVALTVTAAGSFTLAPSASSLSVTQGSSATDTISVTDLNGFAGNVSLSASGLPSGVTTTFGTNPTSGSSMATFNASSSATIGTSLVTITGISGSTTASTSISLTVNTSGGQSICSPTGVMALDGGAYEFQMNEYDSTLQECATVSGTGFTITTANFNNATNGSPATYTSIYSGCHWGLCTSSNPFPIEENNIASATSSVSITQPSGYIDDASYDIWFNQTSTTTGQPNGTEIMVWLNHQGSVQPFGTNTGNVTIDGASWAVWTGNQTSWKIVSYVANTPVTSATNLNLLPFFSDAVSRGSLQPTWWLIDVEYGFEIWTGGQGLAMNNFSVTATSGSGSTGSFTLASSAPSLSIAPGASGTDTITVTDVSPFAGSVAFAASGLPTGVTSAFSPASSTSSSVVTFTVASTTVAGSYPVTITGTSGTLTPVTTSIDLTVGGTQSYTTFQQHFVDLYNDIHTSSNGYFGTATSGDKIPYHSVETLMGEAPDYGHETSSETYSYWIWLETLYGGLSKNWTGLQTAWTSMEDNMIPSATLQPTNSGYNASSPATYAPEHPLPSAYPSTLTSSVSVGNDPLASQLSSTWGNSNIYSMHWIIDTDNWYGFGQQEDGVTKPSCVNTFQRGANESVWLTVPQPCWDALKYGSASNGYLDLFTAPSPYTAQWKYTDAPDADARVVQAMYWAEQYASAQGGSSVVTSLLPKAAKLGDYLRYAMFDKYFKAIGCTGSSASATSCPAGSGYSSSHYLLGWYFAWGGALPSSGSWAWRIGDGTAHFGYQNPVAAYALSKDAGISGQLPTQSVTDWNTSLERQLELYRWLQSDEGAIAGGATNSWEGSYSPTPSGDSTFYGMAYDWEPVYHNPPSNQWFGMQVWSMERLAEYYYISGDSKAAVVLNSWIPWVEKVTTVNSDGTFTLPGSLCWDNSPGQGDTTNPWNDSTCGLVASSTTNKPATNWNASTQDWTTVPLNPNLHVRVTGTATDIGEAGSLAKALSYYSAAVGKWGSSGTPDATSQALAKSLLTGIWANYRDSIGISVAETRSDYCTSTTSSSTNGSATLNGGFGATVYVPSDWVPGTMPAGEDVTVSPQPTFLSLRPKYKDDPSYPLVESGCAGTGAGPTFNYHRFWAQVDIASAYLVYANLFPGN